ncbi:MAG: ABC transporter ATP-binding protein, partial [Pseudomonadota bacterium]
MKLAANRLRYGYPGHIVGSDVSLTLCAGEVLCVLGPNGGGKTTLFRTLLGLLEPLGGEITIANEPLAAWPRHELAKVMAYVPQAHAGYFAFSVREMVLMGRTAHIGLFAAPAQRDRDAVERAIHTLGITHLAEHPYTQISGGERQLALIARALAQGSSLLIMDEPTASLDFGNQVLVLDQIRALAQTGIGILFSTHDPDQAFRCADSVMLLRQGGLLCSGAPDAVLNRDNLRALYGVAVDIVELPGGRRACVPAAG